jgi:DNA-binding ferritin-like protein
MSLTLVLGVTTGHGPLVRNSLNKQQQSGHDHGGMAPVSSAKATTNDFIRDRNSGNTKPNPTHLTHMRTTESQAKPNATKSDWHMTGRHFRDYHLLLDDQGEQIFAMSDVVAERIRKLGDIALRSIGDIARHQRVHDNDASSLTPEAMLTDLLASNQELIKNLRATHDVCDQHNDVATASLIENWIDESEKRAWFLYEILH